jgi:hypothetical protein
LSKSTKTTTENKPPAWAEPLFKQSADEAKRLYDSGGGGNTYLGSTVAPLSGTTMSGVNQLRNAGANWNTGGTRSLYQGIGAQSVKDPYVDKLAGVANKLEGPTASEKYLTDTASGKYLAEGNPYYRKRLESDLADTAAQVRSLSSGSGRYGSDVSNRMLADRLGYQRNQALENDWSRERGYQVQASGMIDQARQGAAGLQGNILSQAGALRGQGLDRAVTSTNAMRDIDQKNFENRLAGAEATLRAGGILDGQAQKLLADEVAKFYALDNQDWNRLSMLQGAATGAAGDYGVQNHTSRQPMNVGGILSGIGSLFSGKSDIRAKENIIQVGEANGIPLYEFSYRGERARWIGTMAQAVPLHRSDALYLNEDGLYGVNYARLGFPMTRVN